MNREDMIKNEEKLAMENADLKNSKTFNIV